MKYITIFIVSILSSYVFAHEDTRLTPSPDGSIQGLPSKYYPSYFEAENLVLSIGGNTLKFPPCVRKYFSAPNSKVEIAASWYHDPELLPLYIFFDISPPNVGFKYHLLFNLNTLTPIEFQIQAELVKDTTYLHKLVIGDRCLESINKALASGK